MATLRTRAEILLARIALIGADPSDDDETRTSKALFLLINLIVDMLYALVDPRIRLS